MASGEGSIFDLMEQYDYENLFLCQDKTLGLKAVIAIHDTNLGPAGGGVRMWTYNTEADAFRDALRLARGMTYKSRPPGFLRGLAAGAHVARAASLIVSSLSVQWPRQPDADAPFDRSRHSRTLLQSGASAVQS